MHRLAPKRRVKVAGEEGFSVVKDRDPSGVPKRFVQNPPDRNATAAMPPRTLSNQRLTGIDDTHKS